MSEQLTQAEIVIARFGGRVATMAEITGWPRHKIDNAKRAGHFQHEDRAELLEIARTKNVPLTAMDFVADLANLVPARATG